MYCPKCDAENLDKNAFCRTCGFDLGVIIIGCIKCHQYNSVDDSFCGICGSSIEPSSLDNLATIDVDTRRLSDTGFVQAIRLGFKNYFVFTGRATRGQFWYWYAFATGGNIFVSFFDRDMSFNDVDLGIGLLTLIFVLVTLVPTISVTARRLHDINLSGLWQVLVWIVLIPIPLAFLPYEYLHTLVGLGLLIFFLRKQGDKGPNKYGPDPRE